MNETKTPLRRGGLRVRHLFFAGAALLFVGAVLVAVFLPDALHRYVTTYPGTPADPNCTGLWCGGPIPGSVNVQEVVDHRTATRIGIVVVGGVLALIVAGIGMALDRD